MLRDSNPVQADVRVALVTRIFPPEPGASPLRLGSLVRSLASRGVRVDVLTTRPPANFRHTIEGTRSEQVRVKRFPVLRDRAGYVRGYLKYLSFDLPAFFRLLFLRRPGSVIVEPPPTSGAVVRIVCGLRRIPYLYYAADIWSDAVQTMSASVLVHRVLRRVELFAMRGAARVLSASDEFTERLSELGINKNVVTVRNGADLTYFSYDGEREDSDAPYLLYAGTASETQGAGIFIDAFEHLLGTNPHARLVFVGQGADWELLRSKAKQFPAGQVEVRDRVAPEHIAKWFRGAHASLASLRPDKYDVSFPTRMYASVACGTRAIYAGAGPGSTFTQQPHVGWSVGYAPKEIAHAMRQALDHPLSASESRTLAEWAAKNVSISAVTDLAAEVAIHCAHNAKTEEE